MDIREGKAGALARAISMIEDEETDAGDLLEALHPHTGGSHVVGITGPPGSGKSTLTDRMVKRLRTRGDTVGVIAVDPTSPFSGGALLGDRTRMGDLATDRGVFIRSMGTRGSLGGLSRAVYGAIKVLEASGKDIVLVETVGVGQSEVDIARVADTVVVVFVPGLGDDVQAIKAGITEIGDFLVVNKSDLPGAARVESVLESSLNLAPPRHDPEPRITTTSAERDEGVEGLLEMIREHRRLAAESGLLTVRRRMRARAEIAAILARRVSRSTERWLSDDDDEWYKNLCAGDVTPGGIAEMLWQQLLREEYEGEYTMKIKGKHHLGIAVENIEEAMNIYCHGLGLEVAEREELPERGLRVAMIPLGESSIELLEPTDPESTIGRFIEKRGPGIHHLAIEVEDIDASLERIKEAGLRLIDEVARPGVGGTRVAFLHPKDTGGVLLELVERVEG